MELKIAHCLQISLNKQVSLGSLLMSNYCHPGWSSERKETNQTHMPPKLGHWSQNSVIKQPDKDSYVDSHLVTNSL